MSSFIEKIHFTRQQTVPGIISGLLIIAITLIILEDRYSEISFLSAVIDYRFILSAFYIFIPIVVLLFSSASAYNTDEVIIQGFVIASFSMIPLFFLALIGIAQTSITAINGLAQEFSFLLNASKNGESLMAPFTLITLSAIAGGFIRRKRDAKPLNR